MCIIDSGDTAAALLCPYDRPYKPPSYGLLLRDAFIIKAVKHLLKSQSLMAHAVRYRKARWSNPRYADRVIRMLLQDVYKRQDYERCLSSGHLFKAGYRRDDPHMPLTADWPSPITDSDQKTKLTASIHQAHQSCRQLRYEYQQQHLCQNRQKIWHSLFHILVRWAVQDVAYAEHGGSCLLYTSRCV